MRRTEWLQETRLMRFEEAYGAWTESRLTQEEAAELLGVCARTFRRYIDRYEDDGLDGLIDKRLEQVSHRRAPVDEVMRLADTYRSRYGGWPVKHFYQRYRKEGDQRSYTWVKNALQSRGVLGAGLRLADKWHYGPITYLGMQVAGFPNMFTLAGPQSASVATNFPPAIETAVEWAAELIKHLNDKGYQRVEPLPAAEREWVEYVKGFYDMSLLAKTKSWFTGYNSNVEGHDKLRYMIFLGGAHTYRQRLQEVAENDYEGFRFS